MSVFQELLEADAIMGIGLFECQCASMRADEMSLWMRGEYTLIIVLRLVPQDCTLVVIATV